jgi:hypothetical protein
MVRSGFALIAGASPALHSCSGPPCVFTYVKSIDGIGLTSWGRISRCLGQAEGHVSTRPSSV